MDDEAFSRLSAEASELWLRTFLELSYSYGWRRSELLSMRVRQVDLRAHTIRLDVGSTKNGEGREVAMTTRVAELLQQATANKTAEDFVFTRAGGKPIKDFRQTWDNLTARAGLPNLIVHDLRRSAAKALRAAGVPESVVMAIGGWKTPAMFRRYAIVSTADQRAAVVKLERARIENSPDFGPYSTKSALPTTPAHSAKVQ